MIHTSPFRPSSHHKTQTPTSIERVLLLTLALNLSVALGKIALGVLTNALAITADGFHSLADSASNITGLIAQRIATQPPDHDHPYGHKRFETLAALLIGLFLLLTAWEVLQALLERVLNPTTPHLNALSFGVLLLTLLVNLGVYRYQIRVGKAQRSEILLADAENTHADIYVTLSVMLSGLGVLLTGWVWLDWLSALIVLGLIVRAAWHIIAQNGRVLTDTAPYEAKDVLPWLADLPYVEQVVRIRSRGTLHAAHLDIDVQVPPETTAAQLNTLIQVIRQRLTHHLEGISEIEVHCQTCAVYKTIGVNG